VEVVALVGWLVAVALGGAFAWAHARGKRLEATLEQLSASNQELNGSLRKTIEDRDQTVKRVRREAGRSVKFGHEPMLKGLLPVMDNLERALSAADDDCAESADILDGVRMISAQLQAELARHGVTPIDAHGEDFDPQTHEAIQRAPSAEHPPGTVMSQWQRGYRLHDRLLRPAQVVVACEPPEPVELPEPAELPESAEQPLAEGAEEE